MTDIVSASSAQDWLVVGWFTPDYRPLAEAFAANLAEHSAPYHLFAKQKLADGWNTTRKPSVVTEALDAYPGKTVVLMDVDCIVRGDIEPVTRIAGDVGITVIARNVHNRSGIRHWLAMECSSRVVVFRPCDGARAFARTWAAQIERSTFPHDEHSMAWAFLTSPSVDFDYIPQVYSGRELADLPDGIIVHDSAHNKSKRSDRGLVADVLRMIERPFRTGRTKARKIKGEMSVLVDQALRTTTRV